MNAIFTLLFCLSGLVLLIVSPDNFLATILDGAEKSAVLCLSLIASYAVWMGLMEVWKQSGISSALSKRLRPLVKFLFKTEDEKALHALSMNISVNLLGVGGVGTAYGIESAKRLDKTENAEYSSAMLFVLNATSIQLIPTSVVGIRASLGSVSPADIILPTLITTLFSTLFAILLTRLLIPPVKKTRLFYKKQGAGI